MIRQATSWRAYNEPVGGPWPASYRGLELFVTGLLQVFAATLRSGSLGLSPTGRQFPAGGSDGSEVPEVPDMAFRIGR